MIFIYIFIFVVKYTWDICYFFYYLLAKKKKYFSFLLRRVKMFNFYCTHTGSIHTIFDTILWKATRFATQVWNKEINHKKLLYFRRFRKQFHANCVRAELFLFLLDIAFSSVYRNNESSPTGQDNVCWVFDKIENKVS